jgi:cysteine protease ATG4
MLSGRTVDISRPKNARLVNRDYSSELNRKVKGCELNAFTVLPNAEGRLSFSSSRRRSSAEETEDENVNGDGVRTRILSIWNQVKYGWMVKVKSSFHLETPIWLLGICYCREGQIPVFCANYISPLNGRTYRSNSVGSSVDLEQFKNSNSHTFRHSSDSTGSLSTSVTATTSVTDNNVQFPPFESTPSIRALLCCSESVGFTLDQLKHDLYSRIWLTYRKEFPKISGSQFTSDCGWGCMLRSAQMLLTQTLICHFLNRSWRWTGARSDKEDMIHRMLIKWFADDNSSFHCPFSIHQLVKHGSRIGKKPGDWYGPASAAIILRYVLPSIVVISNSNKFVQ